MRRAGLLLLLCVLSCASQDRDDRGQTGRYGQDCEILEIQIQAEGTVVLWQCYLYAPGAKIIR